VVLAAVGVLPPFHPFFFSAIAFPLGTTARKTGKGAACVPAGTLMPRGQARPGGQFHLMRVGRHLFILAHVSLSIER